MSQNLAQADVMTIFTGCGEVPVNKLRELIRAYANSIPGGQGAKDLILASEAALVVGRRYPLK
jgi:hypothetical protein